MSRGLVGRDPSFDTLPTKTEVEHVTNEFAEQHPHVAVSFVRPAIVGGPQMDNYLRRTIFGMPFVIRFFGSDAPLQFVHEDDVIGAIQRILIANGRGAYNLGPNDWTSIADLARETGRWVVPVPFRTVWLVTWIAWSMRLPINETPPGYLYFARYPWVVAPRRLCEELGYQFRYSSLETVRLTFGRRN